jgi:tetratricopeptide (TPR) repeat protein
VLAITVLRAGPRRRRVDADVARLLRRAQAAVRDGRFTVAAAAQRAAADAVRAAARPGDARADHALGQVLCELGESLLSGGQPEDAVRVLDEAEEAYERLPRRFPVGDLVADVQIRRAVAYGLAGSGASAVVDAQSAVLHHRDRRGDPRGSARALAVNADVLAAYGDPDLAVGSADRSIRLYLARDVDDPADVAQLRRALAVAIAVHSAQGRHDLAEQAGAVARRVGGLAGPAPTVLGTQTRAPVLAVTVATALEAARLRLDRQPPRIGDRTVVRPAVDAELVVPLDRLLVPLGPGDRAADTAARLGGTLAWMAAQLLPLDPVGGARLGLEAHALLAGASRLESATLRHQLPVLGPAWAAALLTCSRWAEAERDPALALDLAAWAAGVAEQLFPATLVDLEAQAVALDVLDHHGRLLAQQGDGERARDAVRAAARLRAATR